MTILQHVIEEQQATLNAGLQEQEARNLANRLREEQDEAYRIGLQADQVFNLSPFYFLNEELHVLSLTLMPKKRLYRLTFIILEGNRICEGLERIC